MSYKVRDVTPNRIYLILTTSPRQFQTTLTLETSLSDFHKMTVTAFKSESTSTSMEIILKRKLKTCLLYRRSRPKIF